MATSEENSLTGRLGRYARVGTSLSGVAMQVGVRRLAGGDLMSEANAADLAKALGNLKGPLVKAAQLLAVVPDLLPEEVANELRQLQSNAPAMGWLFVKRRMKAELGSDWQSRFAQFDREAAAAASLGQVHRAELPDGRKVACKLQYPDMSSAVEADLVQLKTLMSMFKRYEGIIDTREIFSEITYRLREELDYAQEARYAKAFGQILANVPNVNVPQVVDELSSQRLITLSWLEGKPFAEFLDDTSTSQEQRNAIAMNMFRAWYTPFYHYGMIHGDPHFGNYAVAQDGSLNLLDFGCVRIFEPRFVGGVIDLYRAIRDGDQELAVHAYEAWGFEVLTKEIIETLNIWASFLYGPLMEDKTQLLQGGETTKRGQAAMSNVRAELKRIGGVTIPKPFVFMDRAAIGLGSVFTRLKAEVNWYQLFHGLVENFSVERLEANQAALLHPLDLYADEQRDEKVSAA